MIRRRDRYDPLAVSSQPRWLVVWDMYFNLLESTALAPRTNLREVLQQTIQHWRAMGWTVESDARFGSFFCHCAGARRLLAVSPVNPAHSIAAGPSWYDACRRSTD